jgi:hypothetical protein
VAGSVKPGTGSTVLISVKPDGDTWYAQREAAVDGDGKWTAAARLGNAATPAGTGFTIKAELKDSGGAVVGQKQVHVVLQ